MRLGTPQFGFWDDAQAHYGIYDGRALEFAELTVRTVRESCQATMHLIANQTLELHGEQGGGETMCVAYHSIKLARQHWSVIE